MSLTFAVVLLFLVAAFTMWGVISPQGMWRATKSWQYKNPEANEPSDAGYTAVRISSLVIVLITVCGALFFLANASDADAGDDGESDRQQEEQEVRQEYEDCLTANADRSADTNGFMTAEEFCDVYSPTPDSGD